MKYTVRQATATGKVDPKFGTEYIVHFNEDEREVKMSRQKPVEVGQEENGTIVNSKYGAYFKKDPFVPQAPASPASDSTPQPTGAPARSYVPRKDNSDGMRQGMCINNAANYVNSLEFPKALTDREWAELVHSYATALYVLGDLKEADEITPATVAGVFGAN